MKLFDSFPTRYLVPNTVTCVSLVFGLASIHTSLTSTDGAGFVTAAWFILYAVLLDKADGALARKLKASSEFGVQLDSFSDFVTFGLSPAALISRALPQLAPSPWASGLAYNALHALAAAYVLTAAVRLAKFNVTTAVNDPRFFRGLPSTSSGGLLASAFLAHRELGLSPAALSGLVAWMTANAVLMVSNLPQPKLQLSSQRHYRLGQMVLLASAFVFIPLRRFPTYLMILATSATLGGFVYGIVVKSREAQGPGAGMPQEA